MNDTTRTVFIALGVSLLVIVLVPLLFMMGMMGNMSGSMNGMMNGGGWMMGLLVLLILVASIALILISVKRRP